MEIDLSFPSRYHLWSELSLGQMERLFVEVDLDQQNPAIGETITLRLILPDLVLPLALSGVVVGRRRGSRRFPEGIYLRLAAKQLDKCRHLLGLTGVQHARHGRRNRRVPAELALRFTSPAEEKPCLTRNLSESGCLATTPTRLAAGQHVEATLTLDDGRDVRITAEVAWVSEEAATAGFQFLDPAPDVREGIRACVGRLWSHYWEGKGPSVPIVVADDEPEILKLIGKALEGADYQVYKATVGTEAMGLIRELQPDMVILDILMPGIDGMDVCKSMRADEELADIPVLFVSALEPDALHRVAEEAGATDYLSKPVHLGELLNMVGDYLRTRRAERARVQAEAEVDKVAGG